METPDLQTWQEQEQFVREKYPNTEWVSQAVFDKRFNALLPSQRIFEDGIEFGFCALRLPSGRLLMVTLNG